jgi:DnaJ-class molecular chaperone
VTGELVIYLTILTVILGYLGSLWINPWVKCSRCNGKPQRKGAIFGYAHHFCPKCKGTGQQLRLGRRFIFGRPR